jgi:hypothetical protein
VCINLISSSKILIYLFITYFIIRRTDDIIRRRAITRTIGIGALGVQTLGNAAATDSPDEYYETLRGTITDPITDEDIARTQEDIFSRYTDQKDGSDSLFLTEPSVDERAAILAYNLSIKPNGTPEEHYVKFSPDTKPDEPAVLAQAKTLNCTPRPMLG